MSRALTVGSHQLTILVNGERTYPAMLAAIEQATSSICLETYIFRDDETGTRFAEALMERARAGVEVNLLVDGWGSPLPAAFIRRMKESGVRFLSYNPVRVGLRALRVGRSRLWRRDHRKILVVDRQVGFTGGLNIGDDYASVERGGEGWRDTHLRLEGPAVQELLFLFLQTWRKEGGDPLDEARYENTGRRPDPKVRILGSHMRRGRRLIKEAYVRAIEEATERIWFTSAYFLPTNKMVRSLKAAARRGVDVRLLLAGTTDIPAARYAAQSFYPALLKAGVKVYEWSGTVLHAKSALTDSTWATVGSSNLDSLSLHHNLEVNAIVEDPGFCEELARIFEEDLESSLEVQWRWFRYRPILDRILSFTLGRLQRWI